MDGDARDKLHERAMVLETRLTGPQAFALWFILVLHLGLWVMSFMQVQHVR